MNIVFLAHFAGSPEHGMVYGHYHLAREWVELGHDVTIVAASHAHTRFRQPDSGGAVTEEIIDGIRYLWVRTPAYSANSRFGRIANILSFAWAVWWRRLPLSSPDLVIASSHHPFAILGAHRLAQRSGSRLVFEVRDLWPLTLIELGKASPRNPFIRTMQWAEDHAYRVADKVVSVLPEAKSYMVGRGMRPDKFVYVPNGIDASQDEAQPLSDEIASRLMSLKRQGSFLIAYAGRIGLANSLDAFVDALRHLSTPDVRLVILGEGSHLPALKERAHDLGARVIFIPAVKKQQVGSLLRQMNATYIGLRSEPLFRYGVSPTKLGDYLLAGKPVVCAIDAPNEAISESGACIPCRPDDPIDIARAIDFLASLPPGDCEQLGQSGKRWILQNRSYPVLAKRFLQKVMG